MAYELEAGPGIVIDVSVPGKLKLSSSGAGSSVDTVARSMAQNAISDISFTNSELNTLKTRVNNIVSIPTEGTDGQVLTRDSTVVGGVKWSGISQAVDTIARGMAQDALDSVSVTNNEVLNLKTRVDNIISVIPGGSTGQVLSRDTTVSSGYRWVDQSNPLPSGGTTGQVLVRDTSVQSGVKWDTLNIPQPRQLEVSMSFNANGAAYYQTPVATTLAAPSTRGTGTFAYAYSTDGVTFNNASFPLNMAANSVLRVTVSSIGTYATVAFVRTS